MASQVDITKFLAALKERITEAPPVLALALNNFADLVIETSEPLVPVRTGDLAASWFIEKATPGNLVAIVGYGSGDVDYAVYVHENLTAHHSQGQAKFLEVTMQAAAPEFPDFVIEHLKEAFP